MKIVIKIMTKNIDDELNLPNLFESLNKKNSTGSDNEIDESSFTSEDEKNIQQFNDFLLSKIDNEIDTIKKLNFDILKNKSEIDKILQDAIEDYKKMMFIAFSSEPKISGNIFEPAVQLLKTILESKEKYIEHKISLAKLEIYKEKNKVKTENEEKKDGIFVVERNKIMEIIKKEKEKENE